MFFSKEFKQHVAQELGTDIEDITKAFSSFGVTSKKSVSKKSTSSKPRKVASKSVKTSTQVHKCERIKRGAKDGLPCGAIAKNMVTDKNGVEHRAIDDDGTEHWYCGTAASKCWKAVIGAKERQKKGKMDAKVDLRPSAKKNTTNKDRKTAADVKSKTLLNSIKTRKKINATKATLKNGDRVWIDESTNIIFDARRSAIGVHKDGKLYPLGSKQKRFLEAENIPWIEEKQEESSETSDIDLDSEDLGSEDVEDDLGSEDLDDLSDKDLGSESDDYDLGSSDFGSSEEEFEM